MTLLALWHAYDPQYTNIPMYKDAVKRLLDEYAAYIASIGDLTMEGHIDTHTSATARTRPYHVDAFGRRRVVIVKELRGTTDDDFGEKTFSAWVPKEWEDLAVAQGTQSFGACTDVDLADVEGSIPTPGL